MKIDEIITSLPDMALKTLRDRKANAERVLRKDAQHKDALRLLSATDAELLNRKISQRIYEAPLWWEPHDPYVPEFFGYEQQASDKPVASIFKSATHTSDRKAVYSVRIGDIALEGKFENVKIARGVGSKAWSEVQKR